MTTGIEVRIEPVDLPCGPREAMARLRSGGQHALLDSALAVGKLSQWSFIAGPALSRGLP
jgi:hypothetical protein